MRILGAMLACTMLIILSVLYVDRPLARYAAGFGMEHGFLASVLVTAPVLVAIALSAVVIGAAAYLRAATLPRWARGASVAAILSGLSLAWSVGVAEFLLKPLFNRDRPEAYLLHQVYEFRWFSRVPAVGSFPSGHAAQIASIASVLWILYPRWRFAYVLAVLVVAVALILAERHFLSDIIAGTAVGIVAGTLMGAIWHAHLGDRR